MAVKSQPRFRISGVAHEGSVLVLPDRTLAWPVARFAAVTIDSLALLFEAGSAIELLLIGCGPKQILLPAELRNAIRARDVAVEVMDMGAACRTYNLLITSNAPLQIHVAERRSRPLVASAYLILLAAVRGEGITFRIAASATSSTAC